MKIKLIAPARKPEWGESFWDLKTLCKLTGKKAGSVPLALPTLAALTPSDVEVVLTDENVEPIDFDEKVDLVGITGMTCSISRSYEIADQFKKIGVPVVMGGIHVSMLPDEAIQHCDSVVIGEAEGIWEQVIRDAQKKNLQKFYRTSDFPDLTNAPIPRWDLLKINQYLDFTIQTGRGCPYDCEFCSVKVFNGRKYRHKSIENVIEEVKTLQKIDSRKIIFFTDDNLLAMPSYAEEFMKSLIPLKIRFWCQAPINKLKDDKILKLMYAAGCRVVFIGFESVSQKSLDRMNKSHVNKVEEYKETINKIHSNKIAVFGSFVLGGDADDENIFEETSKFIDDTNIAFSMVNIITPLPGTVLSQRLEKEGRILHKDWSKYNAENICCKPHLISEKQLNEGHKEIIQNIYSYNHIHKRLHNIWNRGVFVRDNDSFLGRFTKGRIIFSIKSILEFKKDRTFFVLRSLWNRNVTSVVSILSALNYHDYTENLTIRSNHEGNSFTYR
ncbi:MAG: radical SAM protein [bacterium]